MNKNNKGLFGCRSKWRRAGMNTVRINGDNNGSQIRKKMFLPLVIVLFHFSLFVNAQEERTAEIRISTDNDVFPWYSRSDRYYTYGLFAALSYKAKRRLGWRIFQNKEVISEINYGLQAYTPGNFRNNSNPTSFDRPFAGWHYLGYGRRINSENQSIYIGGNIGVLGPASGAGRLQNWFHKRIGDEYVSGWSNQVNNQLGVNLLANLIQTLWKSRFVDFTFESKNIVVRNSSSRFPVA